MQQLKTGTLLQGGKYRIESVLGQGGFGITYLATQVLLDRKVAIKEFFYKEYCDRDETTRQVSVSTQSNREVVERFLAKFLKEAKTISKLEHPHIIQIFDIFQENQTAYYVMEYVEGESLADKVNHRGALPEQEVLAYIHPVADALAYIHAKRINHLDVKPGNIMVREKDKQVLLIDFGLSKQYDDTGSQTSSTPVGISNGYAPIEQYKPGGVSSFSPQTDIYSLGATMYKLLTGQTPPSASDILNEGLPPLPATVSMPVGKAIKWAMKIRKSDRPQNIESLMKAIPSVMDGQGADVSKASAMYMDNDETVSFNHYKPEQKNKTIESTKLQEVSRATIESVDNEGNKAWGLVAAIVIISTISLFFI